VSSSAPAWEVPAAPPLIERTDRLERVDPAELGDRPVWLERRSRPPGGGAAEPTASTTTALPANGFEPDASTTQSRRFEPAQQAFDPAQLTTQVSAPSVGRWQPEATVTGHARLADALPPETVADGFAGGAETSPFVRRSYERLELGAGVAPSALRFDDDATHYGFALPPAAADDTSYDALDVEPDPPTPAAALSPAFGDAPIDDDLGEVAGGALAERRRIVLVAGLLSGAPPDALRPDQEPGRARLPARRCRARARAGRADRRVRPRDRRRGRRRDRDGLGARRRRDGARHRGRR